MYQRIRRSWSSARAGVMSHWRLTEKPATPEMRAKSPPGKGKEAKGRKAKQLKFIENDYDKKMMKAELS